MRLYSLQQSRIFQRLSDCQELSKLQPKANLKLLATLLPTKLITVAITDGKCLFIIASYEKIRVTNVVL
jgi:hypothetical protein